MPFRITMIPVIMLSCFVPILSGCGGPARPADLPKLYPCTITVVQDGKPLSDGLVTLFSAAPEFKWAVFAQLDSSGTGTVFTQGLYPGAPEGEYKVVVSKQDFVEEPVGPTRIDGDSGREITSTISTVYTLVGKDYTSKETTPLTLTVSSKGDNKQQFDCGKPVREFLHRVTP